jgi:hypothetical protein
VKKTHLWVYTQKYSTIASWATTIGSASHAPDDIIKKQAATQRMEEEKTTWAYTWNIFLTIASGATPIGSAGRAPDEILNSKKNKEGERRHV